MKDDILRELAARLEGLRWTLSGMVSGGVSGWPGNRPGPGKVMPGGPENPPGAASPLTCAGRVESPRTPPSPPAPPASAPKTQSAPPAPAETPPAPQNAISGQGHRSDSPEEILATIARTLDGCTRCRLHSGRTNLVFGEGSTRSGIVFVGEGPGFDEDRLGRPFVGRAGKLLDKMILAMGFERGDVYICNIVKCRPPDNRAPEPDEVEACTPFLIRQIEALKPAVICALGASAAHFLLGSSRPMAQLRGKKHLWRGTPVVPTYHPAYLLRNPAQKAAAWQDLKAVLKVLGSGH